MKQAIWKIKIKSNSNIIYWGKKKTCSWSRLITRIASDSLKLTFLSPLMVHWLTWCMEYWLEFSSQRKSSSPSFLVSQSIWISFTVLYNQKKYQKNVYDVNKLSNHNVLMCCWTKAPKSCLYGLQLLFLTF